MRVGGREILTKRASSVTNASNRDNHAIRAARPTRDADYFVSEEEKIADVEYVKIWYKKNTKLAACYLPMDELQDIPITRKLLPMWKSLVPKARGAFLYRNLGPVGEPNTFATDTWLARSFRTEKEVTGYNSYIRTYFYRYLVSLRLTSQHANASVHRFVPDLTDVINPRTGLTGYESDWIDDDLVELFTDKLTKEDWVHIKKTAVKVDGGRGDYEAGWKFPDGSTRHSLTL